MTGSKRPEVDDLRFMQAALEKAQDAAEREEVPVGAVLVSAGRIIADGGNRQMRDCDPSAHAEIVVLRRAGKTLGAPRLPGTTLYVTLEPCLMCLGAMIHARIDRLVFGAHDPKVGSTEWFKTIPVGFQGLNHSLAIKGGCLAEESSTLLRRFFRARRSESTRHR